MYPHQHQTFSKKKIIMTDCRKKSWNDRYTFILWQRAFQKHGKETRKHGEKKHPFNIICNSVLTTYNRHILNNYFKISVKARRPESSWWKQKQRKRDVLDSCIQDSVKSFFWGQKSVERCQTNKQTTCNDLDHRRRLQRV